jgi:hypothetical protein
MTQSAEKPPVEVKFASFNEAIACPELEGYINLPILHSVPQFLETIRAKFKETLTGLGEPATLEAYDHLGSDKKDEAQLVVAVYIAEKIGLHGIVTMFRQEARDHFQSTLNEYLSYDPKSSYDDWKYWNLGTQVQRQTSDLNPFYQFLDSWPEEAKNLALRIALEQQRDIFQDQLTQEQTDPNRKRPCTILIYQQTITNLTSVLSRLPTIGKS